MISPNGPVIIEDKDDGRRALLERCGRAYGELGLAVAFTVGIGPCEVRDGNDPAKTVIGWKSSPRLTSGDEGAALLLGRGMQANPVVPMGLSGFIGIDVDDEETFAALFPEGLPSTLSWRTGKGRGMVFRRPQDEGEGPKKAVYEIGPKGVTAWSEKYLVVPPAIHHTGRIYTFEEGQREAVVLPAEALAKLDGLAGNREAPGGGAEGDGDGKIREGERNAHLTSQAGGLRRRGSSQGVILAALMAENLDRCRPPLSEAEVESIAASVMRYAPEEEHVPFAQVKDDGDAEQWPDPLDEAAFHGIAGKFVRLIEPHSEADPAALLIQLLVIVGNAMGRNPHVMVEADRHGCALFCALVGRTSRGRKGVSEGQARRIVALADPLFEQSRIQSGLSSGEGLLFAVRDEATRSDKKTGDPVVIDPGEPDKRLVAIENEMATVLRAGAREGNTLSGTLRKAWDSKETILRTLTKNSPLKSTEPHISLIGHITADELRRELTRTEAANGFGNRILWVCARRSKLLPRGGAVATDAIKPLGSRLMKILVWARAQREILRTEDYWALWEPIYKTEWNEDRPGLLGALTSRAEAQVTRLALVYALLDCSPVVDRVHLEAALAVWRYCDESTAFIFGSAVGDPLADEILSTLRRASDGLSRNEIRDYFGRNQSSARIGQALGVLLKHGLARVERRKTTERPGRPEERWYAVRGKREKRGNSAPGGTGAAITAFTAYTAYPQGEPDEPTAGEEATTNGPSEPAEEEAETLAAIEAVRDEADEDNIFMRDPVTPPVKLCLRCLKPRPEGARIICAPCLKERQEEARMDVQTFTTAASEVENIFMRGANLLDHGPDPLLGVDEDDDTSKPSMFDNVLMNLLRN